MFYEALLTLMVENRKNCRLKKKESREFSLAKVYCGVQLAADLI